MKHPDKKEIARVWCDECRKVVKGKPWREAVRDANSRLNPTHWTEKEK